LFTHPNVVKPVWLFFCRTQKMIQTQRSLWCRFCTERFSLSSSSNIYLSIFARLSKWPSSQLMKAFFFSFPSPTHGKVQGYLTLAYVGGAWATANQGEHISNKKQKTWGHGCGKLNWPKTWAFINSTAGINEASVTNLSRHDRGGDSSWPD